MIRSTLIVLAALAALVSESTAHGTPRVVSPSVVSIHPDPVWYEWDQDAEEDRIPNPAYTLAPVVIVGSPPARAELACHVRELSQGSGMVKVCEVKP